MHYCYNPTRWNMEDNLNLFENGRWPQYFSRQPKGLIFSMQTYFNRTRWNMEDNLNFLENGRQPQFLWKWKTTSFSLKMEDLSFLNWIQSIKKSNERWLQYSSEWKTTSKIEKMKPNTNKNWFGDVTL